MRQKSPKTKELIEQLNQRQTLFQRVLSGRGWMVPLLREIGDAGELGAIPDIVNLACERECHVADAAIHAVHHLLSQATPDDLAWLDEEMRVRLIFGPWAVLQPPGVDSLAGYQDKRSVLLKLASFHGYGFVRQRAVEALARQQDSAELPYLLIRTNDWVVQVRQAAQQAIEDRLDPRYAPAFVENIELVIRLARSERGDCRGLIKRVYGLIGSQQARPALRSGMTSQNRTVRRVSYDLAFSTGFIDIHELLALARRECDHLLHINVAKHAIETLDGSELRETLTGLLRDQFVAVRQIALEALARRFPELARAPLEMALLDSSISLRETARFQLRRTGGMDFAAFYREAIRTGASLYGAILGLGETGTPDDAGQLLPFLQHETIRVRKAALRAVARLAGDRYAGQLFQAMSSDHPGLSRTACEVLLDRPYTLDPNELYALFSGHPCPHVRRNALLLFGKLGKWQSLPYLIRTQGVKDSQLSEMAHRMLQRWLMKSNCSFASPTTTQLHDARQALQECGNRLSEAERRELAFILGTIK